MESGRSLLGRRIRLAVGPYFDNTSIKYLDVYIRQAWVKASAKETSHDNGNS